MWDPSPPGPDTFATMPFRPSIGSTSDIVSSMSATNVFVIPGDVAPLPDEHCRSCSRGAGKSTTETRVSWARTLEYLPSDLP